MTLPNVGVILIKHKLLLFHLQILTLMKIFSQNDLVSNMRIIKTRIKDIFMFLFLISCAIGVFLPHFSIFFIFFIEIKTYTTYTNTKISAAFLIDLMLGDPTKLI